MMIIDTHVHVWVEHCAKYPHHRVTPLPAFPVEELLSLMEDTNVYHAVLIQPSLYGYDNAYIADCINRYPDQLIGVGVVDVRSEDVSGQLRYWVEERGLRGIRLMPITDPCNDLLNGQGAHEIFDQAATLGITISLFIAPRHILQVKELIYEYPDTKVIIEHLGRPDDCGDGLEDAVQPLLQLANVPSVHVKLSGFHVISSETYPYSDTYPIIQAVWNAFGSRRIIWGSDVPGVLKKCTYHEILQFVQEKLVFLSGEDRDRILFGNARTLWGISDVT